jgi:hypothetical protein
MENAEIKTNHQEKSRFQELEPGIWSNANRCASQDTETGKNNIGY